MSFVVALLMMVCTLWTLSGLVSVFCVARRARRRRVQPTRSERLELSVLKPLCGADPGLEANLASFFEQDYADANGRARFELVFGVEDASDPALQVVAALQRRYPNVPCAVAVHSGGAGINPKVRNLRGMLPHASHDLVVVSDSNVRAPRHYLRELASAMSGDVHGKPVGLVTNLFVGTGENTLGAALESVQLNGFCAAGSALPTALGDALVVGKSMLFSRRVLARLGGLERVADVLAEDFVLGKMFQHGGCGVRIAPTLLENVSSGMSVRSFLQRHLRWSMLRWRLRPAAHALEPVASPLALGLLGLVVLGPLALVWAFALLVVRDVGGWLVLRGARRAWLPLLLAPLRDLAMLAVWARAPFKRHVTWRGHRVRIGAGTLLFADQGA
jgi:ceramide glucosyltransferase